MEHNVLDVAAFIIRFSASMEAPVTYLKLQKLLYFVQKCAIKDLGRPAFLAKIKTNVYGAYIKEIQNEFLSYGAQNIIMYPYPEERIEHIQTDKELVKIIENIIKQFLNTNDKDMIRLAQMPVSKLLKIRSGDYSE